MTTKLNVGFIGLGIMGKPMAQHILKAGFPLTVYNRTAAKTEGLCAQGAVRAATPAEAARDSDVVITMVSDSPDVEAVVAGARGVASQLKRGCVVIDMSTVTPKTEQAMADVVAKVGGAYLDAPVSGGDVGARNGTLSVMVGGDKKALERARPVLEAFSKTITHCGPVGMGQVAKLCNQILVTVNLMGVCEALQFARQQGLDPNTMINAVSGGAAASWQLSNLGPRIANGDDAPGFMIDLLQKDLRNVLASAATSGTPLLACSQVHQLFNIAQSLNLGGRGTQALAKVLERLAPSHQ